MGKDGGGMTPKQISNSIKAKGLQRLRWYCQFCQKQCRDENGFKCHLSSDAHMRQMEVVASNSGMFVDKYSHEFEEDFIKILSRRYPTTRVAANQVYNEFIKDRSHIHMNATRWPSLSEFVKYLGKESKCVVEETSKGWYITYINRDPTFVKQQMIAADKREKVEITDEERQRIDIEKRLQEMSKLLPPTINEYKPTEISTDQFKSISLSFQKDKETKKDNQNQNNQNNNNLNIFNSLTNNNNISSNNNNGNNNNNNNVQKKSALEEIMEKQEQIKKLQQQKLQQPKQEESSSSSSTSTSSTTISSGWLIKNLIVKIIDKELKEYYKWKGVVEKVSDDGYVGQIRLLDDDRVSLNIDQEFLETVIPGQGQEVMIVDGRHRGRHCKLLDIDLDQFSGTLIDLETNQTFLNIPYEHFLLVNCLYNLLLHMKKNNKKHNYFYKQDCCESKSSKVVASSISSLSNNNIIDSASPLQLLQQQQSYNNLISNCYLLMCRAEDLFVDKVSIHFICPIGKGVIEDPIVTPCGHTFCNPCLQNWLNTRRQCPTDRLPVTHKQLIPNYLVLNILADLIVKCDHHAQGCQWVGKWSTLSCHLRQCQAALPKVRFWLKHHVPFGQQIRVTGSCDQLGNWDPQKSFPLKFSQGDTWEGEIILGQAGRIEYKYFISYYDTGELVYWEGGPNRVFLVSSNSNYRRDIFRNP
ncbi:kin17-like protein [Cavenderia fasciculata]|uniref:Kin17-like protein n=1 Tax=Cavenderia fasciculata TaxID=261658 RepID=F4PZ55_CACFS|nr:kin17-like protein [Cavenderia fasciculata]EGG19084.1 kin17-like protein [Cavenderia fasciculata]|eukprot:XP_004366717.1 kin17-like protein [Cavenderia fasciculata]